MNDSGPTQELSGADRQEIMAAIFAQMIIQQANMAMMLLGKVPHPQSGETMRDLEAARMFIDQLEMLAEKTKGNLSKQEENLLKQSLMSLRLAFVEAVESPSEPASATSQKDSTAAPAPSPDQPAANSTAAAEDESKKKFSKKY
jgi:hypothetical protein